MTVPHPTPRESISPGRLTGLLRNTGFTFDAVKARLGTDYRMWPPADGLQTLFPRTAMRADIGARMLYFDRRGIAGPVADYFVRRGPKSRLDLLIWLFLLNEPVSAAALDEIFSSDDLAALAAMNLVRFDGGSVVCDLALFECAGLYIATDARVKRPSGVNRVMPLHPDSFDFVGSVSRKPVDAVLDLCTGSGVHGLVAARHAKRVVSTDISPRALHFARFNAWLNGITNVEFHQGDLFGAVGASTFDLILANPPYMPDAATSPGDNLYSGGDGGDVLWSRILQGLERHLRPGGLYQMIHMTVQFGNETIERKVRSLLGPIANSCNILIFSNPIAFRNAETLDATSVRYGVTSVKRCAQGGAVFSLHGPYDPPLPFDISDCFLSLEQATEPEDRRLAFERCYVRRRKYRTLTGAGLAMRAANVVLYCALIAGAVLLRGHRALRAAFKKL